MVASKIWIEIMIYLTIVNNYQTEDDLNNNDDDKWLYH